MPHLPAFALGVVVATAAGASLGSFASAPALLRVLSDPSGISVKVDGRLLGRTPLVASLAPGAHDLRFERSGRTLSARVEAVEGIETIHHVVWPDHSASDTTATPPGELEVMTDPSGAVVEIDGVVRGRSPLSLLDVAAGDHQVVIRHQGTEHRRIVRVEPGALASLTVGTAPAAATGWIQVQSGVPLQIVENGVVIGTTEAARTLIAGGRHDLEFASEALGFRVRRTVDVLPGQTTSVVIPQEHAPLWVNAIPWADVFVDGVHIGETPLAAVMTSIGWHVVELSHPQFGKKQLTVQVSLKEPARVSVDMRTR